MLLSRLRLSTETASDHDLGVVLASPYQLHRTIWNLFADHPDRRRDFLYRIDWENGRPIVWMLSERAPRAVPKPWALDPPKELLPALRNGDRLAFELRANPIVTRQRDRHDVVMEAKKRLVAAGLSRAEWPTEAQLAQDEGSAWLIRRGVSRGFALRPEEVIVDCYEVHTFAKPRQDRIRFATCDFHGVLTITDATAFLDAWRHGLGPAKGFGCGLFLLRRAGQVRDL
jgi:CRISPR system Cascade subunit CasE